MTLKLALRNIISRPWRAAATAAAIAIAVAVIFCMLSFKGAVYQYVYATETSEAGDSDIIITYNSSGDRILSAEQLKALDSVEGIGRVTPSLSLYAMLNGEYVTARGFDGGELTDLNAIAPVKGSIDALNSNYNRAAISTAAAEHFHLNEGDIAILSLGGRSASFIISVIAEGDGYFLNDAPFVLIGDVKNVSKLLGSTVYNEVYIKADGSVPLNDLLEALRVVPEFSGMKIDLSKDAGYIEEKTVGLTAPIVVAGAVVVLLALAGISLLFVLGEKDKADYIARLTVVGANRKQLFAVFLSESLALALFGALIGTALAAGVFYALMSFAAGSTIAFSVSAGKLIGAFALGAAAAVLASLAPLIRSFKRSVRENQLDSSRKRSIASIAITPAVLLTLIVSIIIEFTVPGAKGALSAVNILLAAIALVMIMPYVLKGAARMFSKAPQAEPRVASLALLREKRFSRSVSMLTASITVSALLFMAWSLINSLFTAYTGEFENIVLVTNIRADDDLSGFRGIDGVDGAIKAVWRTGELTGGNFKDKTVNIIGSKDAAELVDFQYITPKDKVDAALASGEPCVVLDKAIRELYGVNEGDKVALEVDGIRKELKVAGIVSHLLFSGNYALISEEAMETQFNAKPDTVLVTVSGDASFVAGEIRAKFADKNYYVLEALKAYEWESKSMSAVIDLICALAVIITLFIFMTAVATVFIGRSGAQRERASLLAAGASKNSVLKIELIQHAAISVISFIFAFAASVLFTSLMINALRLFGLYFEFMYSAWIVAVSGASIAAAYALLPLVLNFKKGYNMRKNL